MRGAVLFLLAAGCYPGPCGWEWAEVRRAREGRPEAPSVPADCRDPRNRAPEVPQALQESGLRRVCLAVEADVWRNGLVGEVTVAGGHPLMPDDHLIDAVSTWICDPARDAEGRPVRSRLLIPIQIRLLGGGPRDRFGVPR